jgi:serine protease
MSPPALARRWAIRAGAAAFTAAVLGMSLQYATAATASPQKGTTADHGCCRPASTPAGVSLINRMYSPADPYSPAYHHPYRHGVVPTLAQLAKMRAWALAHPRLRVPALNPSDLSYGGSIGGIGVTDGPEHVYLVFWGKQWGTIGSSGGNTTLSNDPKGAAPYLQKLMKGLGTGSETWSGVMTQYCEGVATGTFTCPSTNLEHVGYPYGGAYAGIWVDESANAPAAASPAQLGTEAINAAAHFNNKTANSNRLAQYVILSPTGTDPDHFKENGFCAWHDWNGDPYVGVTSPYGPISLTNMPYVTDLGASCGENFVNSGTAGILDGFSIVEGHEYAETITDQDPAGGWTNSGGSENGDLCAWNQGPGAPAANLTLPTGRFAMQSTWGNDGAGGGDCEFSHTIISNNKVTVTNPGNQSTKVNTAVSLQMSATDSQFGQTLTWSATGLPTGLSINASTGKITGTPTTVQTKSVTVTATDKTGAHGSVTFTWTIHT